MTYKFFHIVPVIADQKPVVFGRIDRALYAVEKMSKEHKSGALLVELEEVEGLDFPRAVNCSLFINGQRISNRED